MPYFTVLNKVKKFLNLNGDHTQISLTFSRPKAQYTLPMFPCPCSRAVNMGACPHYPCSRNTGREHG